MYGLKEVTDGYLKCDFVQNFCAFIVLYERWDNGSWNGMASSSQRCISANGAPVSGTITRGASAWCSYAAQHRLWKGQLFGQWHEIDGIGTEYQ